VSSNPVRGEVYSIQYYMKSLSVTCDRLVVSPVLRFLHHVITEILLKVELNTMKQTIQVTFILTD
jgi:hypothetical protein